jgi:hypothetical protein
MDLKHIVYDARNHELDIIPFLHNFNEEENLEFQMGILQSIANIKHRKPSKFSSQPPPMHKQPFHNFLISNQLDA